MAVSDCGRSGPALVRESYVVKAFPRRWVEHTEAVKPSLDDRPVWQPPEAIEELFIAAKHYSIVSEAGDLVAPVVLRC